MYFSLDHRRIPLILLTMNLFEKVSQTIEKHQLLDSGDAVLVALSGGPDSVALLYLLAKLKSKLNLKIFAVYINHQIRPAAARKEENFCRELCARLGVKFQFVSENIPKLAKKVRKGIEETARDFRYEQFEKVAAEFGCNKIALGHHIDDRVETVLFRILRGTGRTGLQGISIKRGKYIRPLNDIDKKEILKYLRQNKIKFCVDQSNAKVDYTRNFIRQRLLPLIRKKINANVDNSILNLTDTISEEEEFLETIVDKAYAACVSRTPAGKFVLALTKFSDYNLWLRRRLIRRCIVKASGTKAFPEKVTVDRVLAITIGEGKAVSIPNLIQCERTNNELFIYRHNHRSYNKELALGGKTAIEQIGLEFGTSVCTVPGGDLEKERRSSKVIVDFDKLSPPLLVRNIRIGDKFRPLGLQGNKKIGDYLTDRKVPALLRGEIPVVTDSRGIVWLVGFEIDERVKIDQNTKKVLKIEYVPGHQTETAPV